METRGVIVTFYKPAAANAPRPIFIDVEKGGPTSGLAR